MQDAASLIAKSIMYQLSAYIQISLSRNDMDMDEAFLLYSNRLKQ